MVPQAAAAAQVAGKVKEGAKKVLSSPLFWIIVLLILFLIVRRNFKKIKKGFQVDRGDYQEGTVADLTEREKKVLEKLAGDLFKAIEDWAWTPTGIEKRNTLIAQASYLPDNQLKYLANYYKKATPRRESLYDAVNKEFTTDENAENLLVRLTLLGEQ